MAGCLVVLFISILCLPVDTSAQWNRYEYNRPKMGTEFRVIVYSRDSLKAAKAVDAAYRRVDELNQIMSDYLENSELSRLSRTAGSGKYVEVSDHLFEVIERSLEISRTTNGAFDITVGPFIKMWRETRQTKELPARDELNRTNKAVGYEKIKLNREDQSIRLLSPGMLLDLGAVGKGFAADKMLGVIERHGIHSVLVDAGGDIRLGDAPPGREGWKIGLKIVNDKGELADTTMNISNKAVATSGDLYQFVEIDGKRYSHIVDPRTGLGITDQSRVTVIANDGTTADGYASAISVLGPRKGIRMANKQSGLSVYYIRRINKGYSSWNSKDFGSLF